MLVKFIYSEKATKFCEIFPLLFTVCTVVKSKRKISQNFVAFSEYMNFINVRLLYKIIIFLLTASYASIVVKGTFFCHSLKCLPLHNFRFVPFHVLNRAKL